MLKKFELNITKSNLFTKQHKLLVAFSGGIDSTVLAYLLYKTGYTFDLAHCNFQLRGKEANDDVIFCENFAKSINTNCHVTHFNTKAYAIENKLSIQMAARELRYKWFNSLKIDFNYDYILTAHHSNDTVETIFVNLIRGTGIKGLQGIPEKQNYIVRPMLFFTKQNIINYALKNKLNYREDGSNQEIKYKRNFIRHQIIPELKKLNPIIEETICHSIQYFIQANDIITEYTQLKFKEICIEEQNQLLIDIKLLNKEKQKETLLFEWLHKKKFKPTQINQLTEALCSEYTIGKCFYSSTHQLVIDRKHIIVQPLTQKELVDEYIITSIIDTDHLPIKLDLKENNSPTFSKNINHITIPYSIDLFPIKLRKWKQGDKFKPLGMNGFKKLSDFFKDKKLSLFEKQTIWILESNQQIIWVVGYRLDERFKITSETEKVLEIKYIS